MIKSFTFNQEVSYEEGKALADELGVDYIETSAKTSENVKKVFTMIQEKIVES